MEIGMFSSNNLNDTLTPPPQPATKIKTKEVVPNNDFQIEDNKIKDLKSSIYNNYKTTTANLQHEDTVKKVDITNVDITSSMTVMNNNDNNSICSEQTNKNQSSIALSVEEDSEFVKNNKESLEVSWSPKQSSGPNSVDSPQHTQQTETANQDDSENNLTNDIKRYEATSSPSQQSSSCSSSKSLNQQNLTKQKFSNNLNFIDVDDDKDKDVDNNKSNQSIELRFLVRRREAGALIGKKGTNIKRLRETFKSSVFSIPDTGNGPERIVCIVTNENSLDLILNDLTQLMMEKSPENDEQIELKLLIHSSHAGSIIGMGGQSIKKLRNDSKAAIKIYEMCCPLSNERVCAIKAKPPVVVNTIKLIYNIFNENPIKGTIKPYDALHFDLNLIDKYGGYLPDEPTVIDLMSHHNHHHFQNNRHNPYNDIQPNHHHHHHPLAFNHRHHHRHHLQNVALAAAAAYQTTTTKHQHYPLWRSAGNDFHQESCSIDMQIDNPYQSEPILAHPTSLQTSPITPIKTLSESNPGGPAPAGVAASVVTLSPKGAGTNTITKSENNFGNQKNSENSNIQNAKQTINNNEQQPSTGLFPIQNKKNEPTSYNSTGSSNANNSTIAPTPVTTIRGTNRFHPYNLNHLNNQPNNKMALHYNVSGANNYPMMINDNFYRNSNIASRVHHQQHQQFLSQATQNHFRQQQLNNCVATSFNIHLNDNYNPPQQLPQPHPRIQQQEYYSRFPMNFPQLNFMDRCHRHNGASRSCLCMFLPPLSDRQINSPHLQPNNIIGGTGEPLNHFIQQQQQPSPLPPSFVHMACKNHNQPAQVPLARSSRANNETFKKK